MRLLALGLLALLAAAPAQSQQRIEPEPRSTFVISSLPGEAVRVVAYESRPPERGRLTRRYIGLRANRAPRRATAAVPARPVRPVLRTPDGDFVRRGTSYFPVVRAR